MASLTIRQLDEEIKSKLRMRAAQHGRSMEDEVRAILISILLDNDFASEGLATKIHSIVIQNNTNFDVQLPDRESKPSSRHQGIATSVAPANIHKY